MKSVPEIAQLTGVNRSDIHKHVFKLNIKPVKQIGYKKWFDYYQVELIIDHLFYLGKIEYLTYESSMNHTEPLYSIKEFLELGHLKRKKL